jgi:hypothetical protein
MLLTNLMSPCLALLLSLIINLQMTTTPIDKAARIKALAAARLAGPDQLKAEIRDQDAARRQAKRASPAIKAAENAASAASRRNSPEKRKAEIKAKDAARKKITQAIDIDTDRKINRRASATQEEKQSRQKADVEYQRGLRASPERNETIKARKGANRQSTDADADATRAKDAARKRAKRQSTVPTRQSIKILKRTHGGPSTCPTKMVATNCTARSMNIKPRKDLMRMAIHVSCPSPIVSTSKHYNRKSRTKP